MNIGEKIKKLRQDNCLIQEDLDKNFAEVFRVQE